MSVRNAISEYRDVIVTFDDGTAAQLGAPIDSYKGALEKVALIEGQYAKLGAAGQPDLTDKTVLITGTHNHQIYVFSLTTVLATGNYQFVFVEKRPNVDNEL